MNILLKYFIFLLNKKTCLIIFLLLPLGKQMNETYVTSNYQGNKGFNDLNKSIKRIYLLHLINDSSTTRLNNILLTFNKKQFFEIFGP